jgi:hypothetical protein
MLGGFGLRQITSSNFFALQIYLPGSMAAFVPPAAVVGSYSGTGLRREGRRIEAVCECACNGHDQPRPAAASDRPIAHDGGAQEDEMDRSGVVSDMPVYQAE